MLDKANKRLWEEKREQQKKEITRLVSVVDDIALKYQDDADRYSFRSITLTNPVVQLTEKDEVSVCKVYHALCLFAAGPSAQELKENDEFLAREVRPDPIYSPSFPKPRVQWSSLNSNYLKNMPKPQQF